MSKVLKDPVHGEIELHPLCVKIVDTLEFQRLRFIKQLGCCYFVYPGAAHNRFEHCIGVCHLAGKLAQAIRDRQPDKINDRQLLCVKIAGLCHDLGHGPFSHMFEHFVNSFKGKNWKHEEASRKLVVRIYGHLKKEFKELGGLEQDDIDFIKDLIDPPEGLYQRAKDGNVEQKKDFFLYEIVSNATYGVDVDKWDYFARDSLHLGVKTSFDHDRLITSARACTDDDGVTHVAYREKVLDHVYEMFHIRYTLHRKAYQHKVNKAIELMISDAMGKANFVVGVDGYGKEITLSEAVDDLDAFRKLTDQFVLDKISEFSKEARELVDRIYKRKLYRFVGEKRIELQELNDEETVTQQEKTIQTEEQLRDELVGEKEGIKKHIKVQIAYFDYGAKDKNPVDKAYFYTKNEPDIAKHPDKDVQSDCLMMKPKYIRVRIARVFCTEEAYVDKVKALVDAWNP
ncbi:deoxynucleoside triphosphate triphosphohydrolase SAMHD1-like isoform X2 [Mizuhopecten yessoensis]|uniref:deoxynucleoside triphosphate triphosphohydrolase SAMHD1-like isoform X2 n=1 Tax=Mizuhopecten yessoensis TaxID=6573 RepID=UPI000B459A55|nr:deoxynucleoside triphosphate triphosphohydrolase SAMHD1-like isoform X2 [Mizuhopecten yessoensis]